MKQFIFALLLCCTALAESKAQAIIADPAVNIMRTVATNEIPVDPFLIPIDRVLLLKVPVINYNLVNALPAGSCKIKIGLGSRMVLNPDFNLGSVNTSNYFLWTAELSGGQVQITGELIASLPANYADTVVFQLKGSILGNSTITTNFLVTNHNTTVNLSDENGTNNNTSLAYTIIENDGGPLPVTFTSFSTSRDRCTIGVNFKTANEVNVDRFEIEVSKDGTGYTKMGTLAAGNNGQYNFTFEISAAIKAPNLFVRIKSVDVDGQFQYSNVSKIAGECSDIKTGMLIFPNPAPKELSYFSIRKQQGSFRGTYHVSLLDLSGRMVSSKKIVLLNEQQFNFYHAMLASGEYIVQLISENGEEVFSCKFQKL